VKGNFAAVNSFLISCRCRYALDGPAPAAHLGDGCSDLVLVHKCSMLDYTQHLYRCSDASLDQVIIVRKCLRKRKYEFCNSNQQLAESLKSRCSNSLIIIFFLDKSRKKKKQLLMTMFIIINHTDSH